MRLDDRVGLPTDELAALERALAGQHTLQQVVSWGAAQTPSRLVAEVIVQDEFTHDVVVPYRDGLHLVYDTT